MKGPRSRELGRRSVLFVYHGTSGIAGAYIHGIAHAVSARQGLECHMAVNRYYPFREAAGNVHVFKPFFRLSETTDRNRLWGLWERTRIRLPLRYAELAAGYAATLGYMLFNDVDAVNLSVIDDELPTLVFARLVKLFGRELHVTAHDVVFKGARSCPERRRKLFGMADRLVGHYDHVRDELVRRLGAAAGRVSISPFPWSEVEEALDPRLVRAATERFRHAIGASRRVFLLPGVLRQEKGLDCLLEAWGLADLADALLVVAGKPTPGVDLEALRSARGVLLYDRYLTGEELWSLLRLADVVVLPYSVAWYAHSSMALMAFLAAKPVVASKIPLFERLVPEGAGVLCEPRDARGLAEAVARMAGAETAQLREMGRIGQRRFIDSLAQDAEAIGEAAAQT